jgi:hypothetical protein
MARVVIRRRRGGRCLRVQRATHSIHGATRDHCHDRAGELRVTHATFLERGKRGRERIGQHACSARGRRYGNH